MVRFVEPRVIKLAETKVNTDGVRALLKELGGNASSWLSERIKSWPSESEMLIEVAGRTCYESFGTGINPNITKVRNDPKEYFRNILSKGDGSILEHASVSFALVWVSRVFCYSGDTEILTLDGWKRFDAIRGDEDFLTLNPRNYTVEYLKATKLFQVPFEGNMIRIKSSMVDLLVTPNHRIFYYDHDKRSPTTKVWKFSQAKTLVGKRFRLKTSGIWPTPDRQSVNVPSVLSEVVHGNGSLSIKESEGFGLPADAFAAFMGFYQSEGHLIHSEGTGYGVQLSQSVDSPYVPEMVEAIRELGFQPRIYRVSRGGEYGIRFFSRPLYKYLEKYGRRFSEKRVPDEIKSLSQRQIRLYLDTYTKGDGSIHKKNGHRVIYTSSKHMADDLQELALKAGFSASVRVDDRVGRKHFNAKIGFDIGQTVPNYIVSFRKASSLDPMINQARTERRTQVREEAYSGIVYCVSVPPNELLYVRRNGKPVWCGNTHELVRHRVGTAYCLSGDTMIYSEKRPNGRRNGPKRRSLSSLFERTKTSHGRSRIKLLRLRSLNESTNEFETSKVQTILYSGRKPLYELELQGGYKCKMSLDHTIYTDQGWFRLGDVIEELKQTDRTLFRTLPIKIAVNGYQVPASALLLSDGSPAYRSRSWVENQVRSGKTYKEIGSLAGTTGATVRTWIQKLGLTGLSKSLKLYVRPGNKGLHYRLSRPRTNEERSAIAERMKGPLNHRWKGGHIIHQVPVETRLRILLRDNHTCQICEKSYTWRKLHVHHIDPWEPQLPKNNDGNLITLCKYCHGKVNGIEAQYAQQLFQKIRSPVRPVRNTFRHKTVLRPKFSAISNLRYVGEEDTYDIVLSGPHHNFLANGVVVHNSQESLRYVRIEEIKMPDWKTSVDPQKMSAEMEEKMTSAVKELESKYRDIIDKLDWDTLSFDEKKSVTSAIRRMLPQGLSTVIVFTANHRTLRWLIEMRTSPGAEYEIRRIFGQIAEICLKDYPLIYNDFESTKLPDGTLQYKPTLRSKV